jgi:MFS family permease
MSMVETSTAFSAGLPAGPLEARHLQSWIYRNATVTTRLTSTHWHIAWANGLGWGFDGMDGAILALVAPLLMKEFAIDLGTYWSGVQIALFVSILGLYLWPWLADRFGRRNVLALSSQCFLWQCHWSRSRPGGLASSSSTVWCALR